jgi:hypothetical protein
MTDLRTKKSNARNWQDHLTREERRELAALEKVIAKAAKLAELPRLRRLKIQNRATVRAGR